MQKTELHDMRIAQPKLIPLVYPIKLNLSIQPFSEATRTSSCRSLKT